MGIFKPLEIKSVVDPVYQTEIYNYLTNIKFDWHFMEDATNEFANLPATSTPSFGNLLYYYQQAENPHFDFFKPLIEKIEEASGLKIVELLRVRAGFLLNTKYSLPSQPYKHNEPHQDFKLDHYTAVYYVNEADGDTIIFNQTEQSDKYYPMHKCTPERGKVLVFNGKHFHASSCPKIHTKRIAITINFTA